jgi:hypothetical protein
MAGLTLTELSHLVFYSKGQLSKVERGLKPPSRELARLCDATLGADGQLAALVTNDVYCVRADGMADCDESTRKMRLPGGMSDGQQQMSRRRLIETGILFFPTSLISKEIYPDRVDDSTLVGTLRSLYDHYRKLGQVTSAAWLLPSLSAHVHSLRELAQASGPRTRQELLLLAARYAEYLGWLAQEAGQDEVALWWTRHASELALAGNDPEFASYGLVRHALVTMYAGDSAWTIELARQAQEGTALPRILGLAAQREAQGHALAGDYDSCMRSLDRARSLLSNKPDDTDRPVIGTTNLSDPAEMVRGWCLYDLGLPLTAAEVIDQQMQSIPDWALRSQVRYGARRALAYASAGEVDHACQLTVGLLDAGAQLGSATIVKDLRSLARTLQRHPKNQAVRAIVPKLWTSLQTTVR